MSAGPSDRQRGPRLLAAGGVIVVALYAGALAFHPLDAYDLFWHLATGRLVLQTHDVPRSDPFSFASDRGRHEGGPAGEPGMTGSASDQAVAWIDHEWLWQVAAQKSYEVGERLAPRSASYVRSERAGDRTSPDPSSARPRLCRRARPRALPTRKPKSRRPGHSVTHKA